MGTLDEMFADIKQEGTPLAEVLQESAPESQPENEPEEVQETKEPVVGDIPTEEPLAFHRHPRWIERENELKELRERDEETQRELAELKTFREETTRRLEPKDTVIPDWFSELYGENEVAWRKYSEHEQARTEEIEMRILQRQQADQARATQEEQKWSQWVSDQIQVLEDNGHSFDQNKLMAMMLEYKPTDENNNLDFEAGLKIYKALEGKPDTEKSDARKQIADTTTKTSTRGEAPKKDYLTSHDLRGRSMIGTLNYQLNIN